MREYLEIQVIINYSYLLEESKRLVCKASAINRRASPPQHMSDFQVRHGYQNSGLQNHPKPSSSQVQRGHGIHQHLLQRGKVGHSGSLSPQKIQHHLINNSKEEGGKNSFCGSVPVTATFD